MPSRKQIRRRRFTALACIVACFLALTIYFNETTSGVLHTIQRGAMEVVSPLQDLASGAIKPFSDLIDWIGDSWNAKEENEDLKRELQDARITAARLQQADSENEKLRALLDFNESAQFPAGYKQKTARVIVASPTEWFARVTIDKGSSSGIKVNQPVIADGALAGKVTTVSRHAAQVTLLTDSSSGVSGRVAGKDILGIVKTGAAGRAGADDLQLAYVRERGEIRVGSSVVTSGTVTEPVEVDSLFPRGIPIGRVTKVDPEERRLYGRVHLRPFVDMRDIQIVQVLIRERD